MKTKKHPNANLENYSKLFAQLGLVLTLTIVYVLIQNKTFSKDLVALNNSNIIIDDNIESIIIYEVEPPKVKILPKKVIIDVVKQIDDDEDIIETIIDNIDPETPVEINEIVEVVINETIIDEVPFIILEDAPVFPGCKGTKTEMKACFTNKIRRFVGKKFNSDLASTLGLTPGVQRISVIFKINNFGNVVDIEARAPHKSLQEEAIRVINLLPKMEPGKQRGKPVTVKYALPIAFKIE
jgi:protein TonB